MKGKEISDFVTEKSQKIRVAKAARDNASSQWGKQYWQTIINAHKRDLNATVGLLLDVTV